jgi:hypothetical protein
MNKIFNAIFATLLVFMLSAYAFGAPDISEVSGSISTGDSTVISGSDFGTKSPAAPMLFDNFNSGSSGSYIIDSPNWTAYSGSGATYSSTSPYGGTGYCAHNSVIGTSGEFRTNYYTFSGKDELYYTYQNRYTGTGAAARVYKNGRMNTGSNRYSGDGMLAISDNYIFYRPGSTSVYPDGRHFTVANLGSSSWQRYEMYGKFSSPAGSTNGTIWVQVANEKKTYSPIVYRQSGYSFQYTSILLGLMMANTLSSDYHYMYVDDVYVDSTQARVELCSGSTWSNKGHCAIQIPSAWSSTSITITGNEGALDDNAYLYVIDSTGSVSPAYPVLLGETGETYFTCYLDADGDDYGTGDSEYVTACSTDYYIASALISTAGDCNDADALINPSAEEICGNAVDENCDTIAEDCGPTTLLETVVGQGTTTIMAGTTTITVD